MSLLATIGHEIKAVARVAAIPKLTGGRNVFAPSIGGSLSGAYGAGNLGAYLTHQSAEMNYERLVGDPLSNGVVAGCANAIARAMPDAPLVLEERTSDGWQANHYHPCLVPLRAPNEDHSDADIWGLTSIWKATWGQGFWLVLPNKMQQPGEIHVWHPARVTVLGASDQFISGYRVQKETGEYFDADKRQIIHFRHLPDPNNPRVGWNALSTGRAQIAGDNMSATYHTAILHNAGVISLLVTLKDAVTTSQVTPEQFEAVINNIRRATLENAGGVNGLNVPLDVHKMAYSPDEMGLSKLIEYYETRICSVMGVSQRVAGLGADPTYLNLREALNDFWERTIVPGRNADAATLNRQWLPLWGLSSQDFRFRFDFSNVPALQENKDGLHTRVREDYKVGALDLRQLRTALGYAGDDAKEKRYEGIWFGDGHGGADDATATAPAPVAATQGETN